MRGLAGAGVVACRVREVIVIETCRRLKRGGGAALKAGVRRCTGFNGSLIGRDILRGSCVCCTGSTWEDIQSHLSPVLS